MQGTVKFFDDIKGYGFIMGEDGTEYFIHRTKIKPKDQMTMTLARDEKVSFDPSASGRGPVALMVEKV